MQSASLLRPFIFTSLALIGGATAVIGDDDVVSELVSEAAVLEAKPTADAPKKEAECPDPWLQIPPVRGFPRLGFFPNPPSGPGYYSLEDCIHGKCSEKPPKFPYPPSAAIAFSFFDADFRYLEDPKNQQHDFFDPLHRMHLGCNWLFNTGGDFRIRHVDEHNSRLGGADNSYDLFRTRVYGDLWYRDQFRVYAEVIDADSFNEELAPLGIDVNRTDFLNLFVDVKLGEIGCKPVYARVGRQELLLGSERLISPLDWANTRRTFQGVRAFRQGEKFDIDVFWVQPVIIDPSNPDETTSAALPESQDFYGVWTTYRPRKGVTFDNYYLYLDNPNTVAAPLGLVRAPVQVHTLGTRYAGDKDQWLWDVEAMYQFGDRGDQSIAAGAATIGGGYHFKCLPWNPTFWVYYDYASGDQNSGEGDSYNTFNQLFAFGHYYMGWLDQVARQNIHDINAHLYLYPSNWITVWLQYHHFQLACDRDALYNAGGTPIRRDATGGSGRNVGNEIDLVVNLHLTNHADLMLGYSKLFAGDFIRGTGPGDDADMLFMMYSYRW